MARFRTRLLPALALPLLGLALVAQACSAGNEDEGTGGSGASGSGASGQGGGIDACPRCEFNAYIDCEGNSVDCGAQKLVCAPTLGCAECVPGQRGCIGNEVHACTDDGKPGGELVEMCDTSAELTCSGGECKTACQVAEEQSSNVGCEFWAVDLDQQDALNDPASAPWGLAFSNAGNSGVANITVEINEAPVGEPPQIKAIEQVSVGPGEVLAVLLPTRELDCGPAPNTYTAPGTCLSSNAFRVTSSNPIIVYQFNVFENQYSNDASLLLPSKALGQTYRVIGWGAGHPIPTNFPGIGTIIDRSYVTIVGTEPATTVRVNPSWKIRGNPPIAPTPAGGEIELVIGEFDVLNLETDDASFSDDAKTMTDLSGTAVYSDKPVAVFSGTESTGAPGAFVNDPGFPTPPGWTNDLTCCLDHLEEQLFPVESIGKNYVITRSPVRSTSSYREPDIIRFVGAAEPANVTTSLPAPFASFTLQPGEVRTTWTQGNFTATADKPFQIGQILVSQGLVDGPALGDPSLTVFPPIDQFRTEYVILTPGSWDQNWVVIAAEVGANVTVDGAAPTGCATEALGTIEGKTFESRKCALAVGAHGLSGDKPFGIVAYGYGSAGSYAFVGGADVKKIYEPPPPPK
jgi:hypothetical protein